MFALGYKKDLQVIKDYLQGFKNLCPIGRYGSFKYNNQDHSLLMGMRAAENFIRNTQQDLQSINSQELYEEDFELSDVKYDQFEEI